MQTVQEKIELLHEKLAKVKAGGGEKRIRTRLHCRRWFSW